MYEKEITPFTCSWVLWFSFVTKFSDLRSNQTEGLYEIMLPSCDRYCELQAEWTSRDYQYAAPLWGAESVICTLIILKSQCSFHRRNKVGDYPVSAGIYNTTHLQVLRSRKYPKCSPCELYMLTEKVNILNWKLSFLKTVKFSKFYNNKVDYTTLLGPLFKNLNLGNMDFKICT